MLNSYNEDISFFPSVLVAGGKAVINVRFKFCLVSLFNGINTKALIVEEQ